MRVRLGRGMEGGGENDRRVAVRLGQLSLTHCSRTGPGPGCTALAVTERRDVPAKSTAASVTAGRGPWQVKGASLQGVTAARAKGEADLLRRWEGGQATYCSRRGALPETAGCTITLLRRPQQTDRLLPTVSANTI